MNSKIFWPGELISKEEMLSLVRKNFARNMLDGKLLFALAYPNFVPVSEKFFTIRLCRYDSLVRPVRLQASFDGLLSTKEVHDGDWFIGSCNAGSNLFDRDSIIYGGFSILVCLGFIRLHYCRFNCGKTEINIYYHIPYRHDSILYRLIQIFDMIIHENTPDRERRCRLLLELLGEQLCCELSRDDRSELSVRAVSQKIKSYLDRNFTGFINCSSVCDALNINRSYGSTVFREDFGISMAEYLLKLRIDAAKYLLSSGHNQKIQEIARCCAFSDTGYFIRVFRQKTGKTPGEFRKKGGTADKNSME